MSAFSGPLLLYKTINECLFFINPSSMKDRPVMCKFIGLYYNYRPVLEFNFKPDFLKVAIHKLVH